MQRPSVGGNGWRSATILGGATAYLRPATKAKSAGPARSLQPSWKAARRSASSSSSRRAALARGSNGSSRTSPRSWRQVPATAPSTRKVGNEWGALVWKMRPRCRSGRSWVRRAWTSRLASQVDRNRGGAGVPGSGRGASGRSNSSPPRSSRNRRGPDPLQHRPQPGQGQAGPGAQVGQGRRPEPGQVAADQVLEGLVGVGRPGAEPVGGQAVQVGPAPLPGARGRNPDHVDEEPDPGPDRPRRPPVGEQPEQLALAGRAGGQPLPDQGGGRLGVGAAELAAGRPDPPLLAGGPDGLGERRVVGGRDDVDGDPQQGRLDRRRSSSALSAGRGGSRAAATRGRRTARGRTGPGARRPVRGPRGRELRALEEELAGQQGPVELAGLEHTLGHGRQSIRGLRPRRRCRSPA